MVIRPVLGFKISHGLLPRQANHSQSDTTDPLNPSEYTGCIYMSIHPLYSRVFGITTEKGLIRLKASSHRRQVETGGSGEVSQTTMERHR